MELGLQAYMMFSCGYKFSNSVLTPLKVKFWIGSASVLSLLLYGLHRGSPHRPSTLPGL